MSPSPFDFLQPQPPNAKSFDPPAQPAQTPVDSGEEEHIYFQNPDGTVTVNFAKKKVEIKESDGKINEIRHEYKAIGQGGLVINDPSKITIIINNTPIVDPVSCCKCKFEGREALPFEKRLAWPGFLKGNYLCRECYFKNRRKKFIDDIFFGFTRIRYF